MAVAGLVAAPTAAGVVVMAAAATVARAAMRAVIWVEEAKATRTQVPP